MNSFFSPNPQNQQYGIALVRIIVAIFMIIHGKEVFSSAGMEKYAGWPQFKNAAFMPYLGKGAEFLAGVLLLPGLLTRVAAVIAIGTFGYIAFFVGHGKVWMWDQPPFMFVLFGLLFIFTGPGAFSLDEIIFKNKRN